MIKSCSLILAFIMSCFINMHSQTVNGAMPSLTLVNKTTFDSAKVQIFYEFSYLQDSTDIAKRINGQTMLTIGKQICGFCDYFSWKNDSINDAYYEQGRSSIEYFAAAMSLEKPTYNYPLVKDISKKETTIQIRTVRNGIIHSKPRCPISTSKTAFGFSHIYIVDDAVTTYNFPVYHW